MTKFLPLHFPMISPIPSIPVIYPLPDFIHTLHSSIHLLVTIWYSTLKPKISTYRARRDKEEEEKKKKKKPLAYQNSSFSVGWVRRAEAGRVSTLGWRFVSIHLTWRHGDRSWMSKATWKAMKWKEIYWPPDSLVGEGERSGRVLHPNDPLENSIASQSRQKLLLQE